MTKPSERSPCASRVGVCRVSKPRRTQQPRCMDSDGWFYTGDLATRTRGRRRFGFSVATQYRPDQDRRAIEWVRGRSRRALLEHPSSAGSVAIVGLPDNDLGQRIAAFVVLRSGEDADADAIGEPRLRTAESSQATASGRALSCRSFRATRWARCRRRSSLSKRTRRVYLGAPLGFGEVVSLPGGGCCG